MIHYMNDASLLMQEFHVFSCTVFSYFIRNQKGVLRGSYELHTDITPENEVFIMPKYCEHFPDELASGGDTQKSAISDSKRQYVSHLNNQYMLVMESGYAQTDEGRREFELLSRL